MSVMSWRRSPLADRHRALGSNLEDWNGMETAWTYTASDLADEHEAVRTKAAIMDVSGLRKVHLVGPHSHHILQRATTRDVRKVTPGKSVYACMLNDAGKFTDDCILYRTGPNAWMVVIGSGTGYEELTRDVAGKNAAMLFDDDLQDLSLQGPLAVDYLERHVPGIRALKYFHHMPTTLFGCAVMISRTGYTGERGYEIFCRAEDAPAIWDRIVSEGRAMGIVPASFTALDWLRVESYLLFYPYDNSQMYPFADEPPGDTLWELGLDFTVSPGKTGFRGAEEHARLKGKERFKIYGVLADTDKDPRCRRRTLRRRQAGRRRHLRDVFAADEAFARHRPHGGRRRPGRRAARGPRQKRGLQGHGACADLRRPRQDEAQRGVRRRDDA